MLHQQNLVSGDPIAVGGLSLYIQSRYKEVLL